MKSELEKALAWWDSDVSDETKRYATHEPTLVAAARRFADLKGEECETCWGSGHEQLRKDDNGDLWVLSPCRTCHGSGKVWNPEVVERVATALRPLWYLDDAIRVEAFRDARAVLAAITEEEG